MNTWQKIKLVLWRMIGLSMFEVKGADGKWHDATWMWRDEPPNNAWWRTGFAVRVGNVIDRIVFFGRRLSGGFARRTR